MEEVTYNYKTCDRWCRTGEILCLGVIKNPSGFTKQVSLSFEFYCNTGGGIEVR